MMPDFADDPLHHLPAAIHLTITQHITSAGTTIFPSEVILSAGVAPLLRFLDENR